MPTNQFRLLEYSYCIFFLSIQNMQCDAREFMGRTLISINEFKARMKYNEIEMENRIEKGRERGETAHEWDVARRFKTEPCESARQSINLAKHNGRTATQPRSGVGDKATSSGSSKRSNRGKEGSGGYLYAKALSHGWRSCLIYGLVWKRWSRQVPTRHSPRFAYCWLLLLPSTPHCLPGVEQIAAD